MSRGPWPGFADHVHAAQTHFRCLLDAVSHPGRIVALPGELPAAPPPLVPAAYALALTLLDHETPVWLGPGLDGGSVATSLRFHCGCPLVAERGRAAFAFASAPDLDRLDGFALGTPDYPDRSTTLVLAVAALEPDGAGAVRLTGPGIREARRLRAEGLPADFWMELQASRRNYPLGLDLVLVAGARIAALPRTTVLEPG
jgi:alpha-D-ribose 1-methylphosphonate 5-triphosphate synthase subunit PhnH